MYCQHVCILSYRQIITVIRSGLSLAAANFHVAWSRRPHCEKCLITQLCFFSFSLSWGINPPICTLLSLWSSNNSSNCIRFYLLNFTQTWGKIRVMSVRVSRGCGDRELSYPCLEGRTLRWFRPVPPPSPPVLSQTLTGWPDLSNLVRVLGEVWGPFRLGVPVADCSDQNREIP